MVCGMHSEFGDSVVWELDLPQLHQQLSPFFYRFLAYPTMNSLSPDPGSATPSPPPSPRAPSMATPVKPLPTSSMLPSAALGPRLSVLFAPSLSDSAAPSPATHGSFRPSVPSSPDQRPSAPAAPFSASPTSALRPSAAPFTAPCSSRPSRNWGAVLTLPLSPPPPLTAASVARLGAYLDLVSLSP